MYVLTQNNFIIGLFIKVVSEENEASGSTCFTVLPLASQVLVSVQNKCGVTISDT